LSWGIRGKIFGLSALLVLGAVAASGAYLELELRGWTRGRIEAELRSHAEAAAVTVGRLGAADPASLDGLADALATPAAARVTMILDDGTVVGDSEFALAELDDLAGHEGRPEVIAARAGGVGVAERDSASVGTPMLYVAVPFAVDGASGTLRVARPLREVEEAVARLRVALGVAGLIGLLGALLMSAAASHLLSRTLRSLVKDARRVADGGGAHYKIEVVAQDELGGLAGSINRLADELEATVAALAVERSRFEAVLESMDEGVIALDQAQQLTMINRAALGLLSLSTVHDGETLAERIPIPSAARAGGGGRWRVTPERREFGDADRPAAADPGVREPAAGGERGGGGDARRDGDPPARADPPRLRGERVARAAHAGEHHPG
jgi:two-component system phosphate regulon sensor histidine kinase PhoR